MAKTKPVQSNGRRVLPLIGAFLLGMWFMMAIMNAQPGDLLYGMRRGVETLEYNVARSPQERAEIALRQANERIQEIQRIITVPGGSTSTTTNTRTNTPSPLISIPNGLLEGLLGSYAINLGQVSEQLPLLDTTQGQGIVTQVVDTTAGHEGIIERVVTQVEPPVQNLLEGTLNTIIGTNESANGLLPNLGL